VVGAALAENPDSSGWNLVFQRARAFTDEDRKMGQDTYSITNESGATAYGGVTAWEVADCELRLTLDRRVCEELGVPRQLTIGLCVDETAMADLGAALAEVLTA
jgi:hydroxylamine reductase (hybrid-cluster protein)